MSRIGDAPIQIPSAVTVEVNGQKVVVKGPLGQLEMEFRPEVKVSVEDQIVTVLRKRQESVLADT